MAVKSKTYNTIPGNDRLTSFTLFGVRILGVSRSTDIYNAVSILATPASLEFYRIGGTIFFDPTNPFNAGEKVWVLYES